MVFVMCPRMLHSKVCTIKPGFVLLYKMEEGSHEIWILRFTVEDFCTMYVCY